MEALLEHLVLVAGHAVFRDRRGVDPSADEAWLLADFQRGEGPTLVEHVRAGVEAAARDPRALLVLSGGRTRAEAPWSEGEGLRRLAALHDWWSRAGDVVPRVAVEAFARDSLENLLFSTCRFRELVGAYPRRVTAVSWGFKAERYELHRVALALPWEDFRFQGVGSPADLARARAGERRVRELFRADPRGAGAELRAKRAHRDPFGLKAPYAESCPELAELLAPLLE